jgi:hypothetical protein
MENKKTALIVSFILVIIILITGSIFVFTDLNQKAKNINSFEECAKYYPVQESFPERCNTPDGRTFVNSNARQQIEVSGEAICLPKRNPGEMQTLECAYGINSDGLNYSISFENLFDNEIFPDFLIGENYFIKGYFEPSDGTENYNIVGKIEVLEFNQTSAK